MCVPQEADDSGRDGELLAVGIRLRDSLRLVELGTLPIQRIRYPSLEGESVGASVAPRLPLSVS